MLLSSITPRRSSNSAAPTSKSSAPTAMPRCRPPVPPPRSPATPASPLRSAPIATRTRIAAPSPPAVTRAITTWRGSRRVTSSRHFDHSKTKFPLLGKHAPLACDKCHKTADFKAPVAHVQCKACHQDIHGGQFAARADGGDCAGCHTRGRLEARHLHAGVARQKPVSTSRKACRRGLRQVPPAAGRGDLV